LQAPSTIQPEFQSENSVLPEFQGETGHHSMPGNNRNIGQLLGQTAFQLKHTSQNGGTELQDLQAPQKSTGFPNLGTHEQCHSNSFQPTDY